VNQTRPKTSFYFFEKNTHILLKLTLNLQCPHELKIAMSLQTTKNLQCPPNLKNTLIIKKIKIKKKIVGLHQAHGTIPTTFFFFFFPFFFVIFV
jgi:hypothetical protein